MPKKYRQPTEAEKDDVEAFIERKVALLHMAETECDILREDLEGWKKVTDELDEDERNVPFDPELRKAFYEKCERIVEQPATTIAELVNMSAVPSVSSPHCRRQAKVDAARALGSLMDGKEGRFPEHVYYYILGESTTRLDALSYSFPSMRFTRAYELHADSTTSTPRMKMNTWKNCASRAVNVKRTSLLRLSI